MLGIDMTRPGINEHLPRLSPNALARLRVAFRYDRPDQVAVIFLDEVSLVTPILLSMIDKRLKEILDSSATWGGVSMIFLGDFQQLNPVSGVALTKAVVDHLVYDRDPDKYIIGTPHEEGINLFVNAQIIVLTEQMRASSDTQHTTMLEQLQNTDITRPVTLQLVDRLQHMILTTNDVRTTPNWRFAPLAVCGNAARQIVNRDQAI
jgi:hypothetical protein